MSRKINVLWPTAVLLIILVALTACAQSATPAAEQEQAPVVETVVVEKIVEVTPEPPTIIRFVFAPDPLMLWMNDSGIIDKYQAKYNMQLKTISTWDEIAFFAGGHADIASTGDYEIAPLTEESGEEYVVFGIYNLSRVPIFVKTDSPYQTIKDLEGQKIGVPGPLSSTMIWGVMLAETEGVDFRVGSDQFDLIANSHSANAELLRAGEIEAGIIIPEALVPELREGTIRPLYGAGGGWEYYRDNFDPEKKHKGVPSNIFLARKEWYDANPKAVEFFLAMWEEGLKTWHENSADIIRAYPEDHGLDPESDTFDEDRAAITKWIQDHDWFVDTVYMDQTWIDKELPLFDLMRKTGFMEEDQPNPVFVPLEPPQE